MESAQPEKKHNEGSPWADHIQFTVPANELKITNRELGAVEAIEGVGRLNLKRQRVSKAASIGSV